MRSASDEKLMTLQDQVKKLQSQKDKLIKELDAVEERFENINRGYRRYFPLIIDSLATEDNLFSKICRNLSMALKKKESDGKIEYIFEQLKTVFLREDIGSLTGPAQKKGQFFPFKKNPSEAFINEYTQGYHEVVNTLRSCLDEKYARKLETITEKIKTAEDTDTIRDIRDRIFSLIFAYISDTSQDREKVNAFVREVIDKIFDIEVKLTDSYQQTDSIFHISEKFDGVLTAEIKALGHTSDEASTLDALKLQVAERLAAIKRALEKKQEKDQAIQATFKKNRAEFKSGFVKLKKELDAAKKYSELLEKKLNQDPLTGAYNRRAYIKSAEEEMERFLRYETRFSLLFIDVDNFKQINDTYGHAIGDRCLQEIIKRTLSVVRKNDLLARYGGDEFVVIMPETDSKGAQAAAEKIRQTIEKIAFVYKKEKVTVTVSIGVSQSRKGDENYQQIFERSDIAAYQAKEKGRNQVVVLS